MPANKLRRVICPDCERVRWVKVNVSVKTKRCVECYRQQIRAAAARGASFHPADKVWLPERRGPVWDAFVRWWTGDRPQGADKRRAIAWKAWSAAYNLALNQVVRSTQPERCEGPAVELALGRTSGVSGTTTLPAPTPVPRTEEHQPRG